MISLKNVRNIYIFFFLVVSFSLYPIDDELDEGRTESTDNEGRIDNIDTESLLFKTLALDIESADYYELLSWCQGRGLDDAGDKITLINRLFEYYQISKEESAGDSGGDVIIIRSANNSEYFTIEEIDENYLVLQGDVILEFRDNAGSEDGANTTHLIKAQRIIINQTKHLLTATGDIEYTLIHEDTDDEPEIFYGNTFTFNIETWNGVFIKGGGETSREVVEGEEEVNFFYIGDTLTRMDNDIVLMEEGIITSCEDIDDPHWQIKASKIWVLAPGEWAITNGLFYVGRVPLLYIPFFFKSGDEVFFHPSFGYKDEEGIYIQTTTYILGQRQTDTSSFSFLRETGDDNKDYEMEIDGLFLRRGKRKETDEEGYIFKIALDYYTRLGFFTGLAVFPEGFADEETAVPNNYFALNGGFGVSRSIFSDSGTSYSPYYNGELQSYWHYVSYFGVEIPVRCGLKTKFIFNKSPFSLSGDLEYYSDPFFAEDFYNREEEFNWDRFLNREAETESSDTEQNIWDFHPEINNNLVWQLSSSLNLNFPNNYLKNFNINNLSFNMNWSSRSAANMSDVIGQADPSREFFYPTNFKFPNNMKITISGELLHLPITRTSNAEESQLQGNQDPGMGIHLPESDERIPESQGEEGEGEYIDFKGISIMEDEPVQNSISRETTFTLSYLIEPTLLMETHFLHEDWDSQEDVDFGIQFSNLTTTGLVKLMYDLKVWNSFVVVNGNINFNSTIKRHFNRGVSIDTWNTFLLNDYMNS